MRRRLSRQLRQAAQVISIGVGLTAWACTSAKENSEFNAAAPTTIQSDADRRAIYNNGSSVNNSSIPSSVPRRLDNQASEINRQKNIEDRGVNESNNKPLEVRTRELGRPAADTLR